MERWVLQWVGGEDGIFLHEDDYDHIVACFRALNRARTWGEFKELLPEGEFEAFSFWWAEGGERVYQDDEGFHFIDAAEVDGYREEFGSEFVITSETPFDVMNVPGYGDGDFPPFTGLAIDKFPGDFAERYGKGVDSMVSGSWRQFPLDKYEEMKRNLEVHGIEAVLPADQDIAGFS